MESVKPSYRKTGQFETSILFEIKVPLKRKACASPRMVTFLKSFWHLRISNWTPDYDDHFWALYFVSLLHYLEKCKFHKKWTLPMHGKVPLLHSKQTQSVLFLFQNILLLSLKCWTWWVFSFFFWPKSILQVVKVVRGNLIHIPRMVRKYVRKEGGRIRHLNVDPQCLKWAVKSRQGKAHT